MFYLTNRNLKHGSTAEGQFVMLTREIAWGWRKVMASFYRQADMKIQPSFTENCVIAMQCYLFVYMETNLCNFCHQHFPLPMAGIVAILNSKRCYLYGLKTKLEMANFSYLLASSTTWGLYYKRRKWKCLCPEATFLLLGLTDLL